VNGEITGEIGLGLLVLLGVGAGDARTGADYLVDKTIGLRIFEDAGGKRRQPALRNRTVSGNDAGGTGQ
jgi:D-tyrosyl-tRNA(Tyr) deacylase